ncbi:MAG TPA: pseudomurein-binding repeat-containing protein, partial [Methanobacterium sp.]|nr:pseudomurein-binding repeat-containing protein [Methanobacterium sp.]
GSPMESLTLEQYRKMVNAVIDFKNINGKMPDFIKVSGCRINKSDYTEMIERVNIFFLEMGRNPEKVEIKDVTLNTEIIKNI